MAYLNSYPVEPVKGAGPVIANTWPLWEQTTPQYPQPQPYGLAQQGFRQNELVFACIQKRAGAVAEAPLRVYDDPDPKRRKPIDDHPLRQLIRRPNMGMGEVEFWQATQIYLDIAGFSVWEAEFNRIGEPLALWPMRPDWCSFKRGEHKPLAFVRYQPPGLPFIDVPVERCLVFMEFDPLYPLLKGLSRSAVALRVTAVDNAATDFMRLFFQNGAVVNGLLKTTQSLQNVEAERIRKMWRDQHGGINNWVDPAVLGSGVEYQPMGNTFKDMDFSAIDGRNETRICQVFETPPILVGARIGLERATYANYGEARQAFYEETVMPRWRWLESEIAQQVAPMFGIDTDEIDSEFDTSQIRALQEDRDAKWERASKAFKDGWVTRDEARQEAELEPVDGGVPVWFDKSTAVGKEIEQEQAKKEEQQAAQLEALRQARTQPQPEMDETAAGADEEEIDNEQVTKALAEWRKLAIENVRGGGPYAVPSVIPALVAEPINAALVGCKTAADVRGVFARHWPRAGREPSEILRLALAIEKATARL